MKDLKDLRPQIQKSLAQKGEEVPSVHSWKKVPTVPAVPAHRPTSKKELTAALPVTKEWEPAANTAACSCHLEQTSSEASLDPERFKRYKNPASALRKIEHCQKSGDMTKKISVVKNSDQEKARHEEEKQDELWRDMMKNQEERQFRLGRITNFFS
jgi:hypothetical protein